ncbi:MAG: hypothetical protein C5B50_13700, partial [Verrucomicrobia bacterium]
TDLTHATTFPRQHFSATPYSILAGSANSANFALIAGTATNFTGNVSLAQLPPVVVTNNGTGLTLSGSFSGNGSGLTILNAGNLSSGTVPDARLSANVALLNGNQTFSGSNTLSGVATLTNADNTLVGTHSGSGAGLTSLNASQLTSGTLPSAQLAGFYSGAVTFNNAANSFTGNGGGLTNVGAATLGGAGASNFWQLGGNTVSAGQFIGSANNQPIEIWANGQRAFRLEPGSNPNVVGGYNGNAVTNGSVGAFIGGGGGSSAINVVSDDFGVVGGGAGNQAGTPGSTHNQNTYPTVGGGFGNQAQGTYSTIGGGYQNSVGNITGGTVGGGYQNQALSQYSTVAGGVQNSTYDRFGTVGGGNFNRSQSTATTIAGGDQNQVVYGANYGTIAGGQLNAVQASGVYGAIGGGAQNTVNANHATVPGGFSNSVSGPYAFAAGQQAQATNQGAFVWADSQNAPFTSKANDQFLIRAQGGVGIGTNNPQSALHVNGTVTAANFVGSGAGLVGVPAATLSGALSLAQLPGAVLTNNESGVALNGSFTGNGAALTNIPFGAVNSSGAFTLTTNGLFFVNAGVPYFGGQGLNAVAAADFNLDGKIDLAFADPGNGVVWVLTNNGSGFFAINGANYPVSGGAPYYVAAGDVNLDGKPDLVTANFYNGTLSVLTNNGLGGFALSANYSVPGQPRLVAIADINGDGKPDLIYANYSGQTVVVMTNNGSGSFTTFLTIGLGFGPRSMAVVDVNADSKMDIVAAGENGGIFVATNTGSVTTPGFNALNLHIYNHILTSIAAGNLRGLGKPDLVVSDFTQGSVTVFTNNGVGGFGSNFTYFAGNGAFSVAVGDVNGDGELDLINGDAGFTVMTNNGSGAFVTAGNFFGSFNFSWPFIAADVNGDGKADLITSDFYNVGVYTNASGLVSGDVLSVGGGGLRVVPGGLGTPSLVGGSSANAVISGSDGAVIAGGSGNYISALSGAVISGGFNNTNGGNSSSILGGIGNANYGDDSSILGGIGNANYGYYSSIGGGDYNTIWDSGAVIGGGNGNAITGSGYCAAICGGFLNSASGYGGFIGGGGTDGNISLGNTNQGPAAVIVGGLGNLIPSSGAEAFIGGGSNNYAGACGAAIGGGLFNSAQAAASTIAGGGHNLALGPSSAIGGGTNNAVWTYYGVIGGGLANFNNSAYGTIGGGVANSMTGNWQTIAGGSANLVNGDFGAIPGGDHNVAGSFSFAAGHRAKANGMGTFVWADSTDADFADNGAGNQFLIRASGGVGIGTSAPGKALQIGDPTVHGSEGMIRLGSCSSSGSSHYSWDIGVPQTGDVISGAGYSFGIGITGSSPQFIVHWSSGFVGVNTVNPDANLSVNGSADKPGGGSWSSFSDARLKKNVQQLSHALDKLLALRGVSFEFIDPKKINELEGERIGMIAQEVEQVFPDWVETGHSGYKKLTYRGFEALTVEALRQLRSEKEAKIEALEQELANQKAANQKLEARFAALEKAVAGLERKPDPRLAANEQGGTPK